MICLVWLPDAPRKYHLIDHEISHCTLPYKSSWSYLEAWNMANKAELGPFPGDCPRKNRELGSLPFKISVGNRPNLSNWHMQKLHKNFTLGYWSC